MGLHTSQLVSSEQLSVVRALAIHGTPYGVGVVELLRERMLEAGWYSDQAIEVKSSESSIWLPAVKDDETNVSVLIYFLYSGAFPARIELTIADNVRFEVKVKPEKGDSAEHTALQNQWWQALREQAHSGITSTLSPPSDDFLAVLGHHLKLPFARQLASRGEGASQLEKEFERTLGMLIGFESIRLAMMLDDTNEVVGQSPAKFPLPSPINVQSVRISDTGLGTSAKIESIATMVPSDCFYVRCKSIQNFTWLRQLLINWGGSLDEIVTSPSMDSDVRGRMELQLGISSRQSIESGLDKLISDMAIIGTDVFFEEGAGIGVLLEAKVGQEQEAEKALQKQCMTASKNSTAVLRSETIQGQFVSFMGTNDQRVRSFFVRSGRYLLVTNSREIVNSVLRLVTSNQSLANLNEYRYAIAANPKSAQAEITFYLSDPFFRRITSPAFRTELSRRRNSVKDCGKLEVAAIVAKAMGHRADSREALVKGSFLPTEFGNHPDGSRVELVAGEAMDSLRGHVGTFVPVADIKTDKVNEFELAAYQNFSQRYRQEWPVMDPVLATVQYEPLAGGIDRIHLDIHVTPYARKEYGFLANYLAEPTQTHAEVEGSELMGVSAHLRGSSQQYLAHIGLCDAVIPFQVIRGELQRGGEYATENIVQQQSFAAVTPAGRDGLQLLAGLVKSLQTRDSNFPLQPPTSPHAVQPTGIDPLLLLRGFTNAGDAFAAILDVTISGIQGLSKLSAISEDSDWSIYSTNSELRRDSRQRLLHKQRTKPTQLHLHAGGIEQAAIAPYLHAYSFCAARQQSAANAVWLTRWTNGLRVTPEDFRNSLEKAIHGKLKCPLGGEFILASKHQSTSNWTSTAWNEPSLQNVNDVPPNYRFPFLYWLKNVEIDFNLNASSLSSEIVLDVASKKGAESKTIGAANLRKEPRSATSSMAKAASPTRFGPPTIVSHHAGPITNVVHAMGGEQAVVIGFDRMAQLWNLGTQLESQVFKGHQNTIWTLAISPDSKTLITGSEDKTLRAWDVATGRETWKFTAQGIFSCVRFSKEGDFVIATNWDGKVRVWQFPSMKVQGEFVYGVPSLDVALLQDKKSFVFGTDSGKLLQCEMMSGRILRTFEGHTKRVHSVAVIGDRVLSASHDMTLRLWDVNSASTMKIFRGHTAAVHEVRIVSNRELFVSCSLDGSVRLWNTNSEKELASSFVGVDVRGISVAPNGSSVLAAGADGILRQIQLMSSR